MSYKKPLLYICEEVDSYLCKCYPHLDGCFVYCMDAAEEGITYPDYDELFLTQIAAMRYLLETGRPVWVLGESGYPYEVLTLNKLETLFDI